MHPYIVHDPLLRRTWHHSHLSSSNWSLLPVCLLFRSIVYTNTHRGERILEREMAWRLPTQMATSPGSVDYHVHPRLIKTCNLHGSLPFRHASSSPLLRLVFSPSPPGTLLPAFLYYHINPHSFQFPTIIMIIHHTRFDLG